MSLFTRHTKLTQLPLVPLHFCGTVVAESPAAKNLGVYVDRHLNYETHIDNVTRKCTGILIALTHARHVIPRVTLKSIVEALVLSVLRYCLSVYGSCGMTQLRRVQKLVNFCVRVVTGKRRYDHVSQSLEQLQWLTAEQLVIYHTVCAVERVIVSGQPESIMATIGLRADQRHSHNTRQASLYTLPTIRTEAGRRRLCYRGVGLLNSVGVEPGTCGFRSAVRRAVKSQ